MTLLVGTAHVTPLARLAATPSAIRPGTPTRTSDRQSGGAARLFSKLQRGTCMVVSRLRPTPPARKTSRSTRNETSVHHRFRPRAPAGRSGTCRIDLRPGWRPGDSLHLAHLHATHWAIQRPACGVGPWISGRWNTDRDPGRSTLFS